MKKFRGKKRYFKSLYKKAKTLDLHLNNESWFDLWHIHLDFDGVSENRLKIRREHIKAHLVLYSNLLKQLEAFNKPYQSWICIHDKEPISDAVYIHSPNPNNDYFPHKVNELNWNCIIPNTFSDLINIEKFNVGFYKSEFEEVYFIQSKDQGVSLQLVL